MGRGSGGGGGRGIAVSRTQDTRALNELGEARRRLAELEQERTRLSVQALTNPQDREAIYGQLAPLVAELRGQERLIRRMTLAINGPRLDEIQAELNRGNISAAQRRALEAELRQLGRGRR